MSLSEDKLFSYFITYTHHNPVPILSIVSVLEVSIVYRKGQPTLFFSL